MLTGDCYHDSMEPRILPLGYKHSNTNTPKECVAHCYNLGHFYAGVENGNECYCGNTPPPDSRKQGQSNCNYRCEGDFAKTCGGTSWDMNVYMVCDDSTDCQPGWECNFKSGSSGFCSQTLSGPCYNDTQSYRILPYFHGIYHYDNTPATCIDRCRKDDFLYAGVEYSRECHCGNSPPADSRLRSYQDCSRSCTGDNTKRCGASWRISMYNTLSASICESSATCATGWMCNYDYGNTGTCEDCLTYTTAEACQQSGFITTKGADECILKCTGNIELYMDTSVQAIYFSEYFASADAHKLRRLGKLGSLSVGQMAKF